MKLLHFFNYSLTVIDIIWRGSEFVFDYTHLLYYECHKVNPSRSGSYINFPDRIKTKKATMNPINKKDDRCLQYAVTIVLNHEEIKRDL